MALDQQDAEEIVALLGPPAAPLPVGSGRPYARLDMHFDRALPGSSHYVPDQRARSESQPGNDRAYPPFSRFSRPINRLNKAAIDACVDQLRATGRLIDRDLPHGGHGERRFRRPSGPISRFRVEKKAEGGYGAMTPFKNSLPDQQLREWDANVRGRIISEYNATPEEVLYIMKFLTGGTGVTNQLQVSHIMWRYTHPVSGGDDYCLLVHGLEVSHTAKAFDRFPWPAHEKDSVDATQQEGVRSWQKAPHKSAPKRPYDPDDLARRAPQPGWRLEISEQESTVVQAARDVCSLHAFMWRDATNGNIIPEEGIDGPTMCPHGVLTGVPCLGPRPSDDTMEVPGAVTGSRATTAAGAKMMFSPISRLGGGPDETELGDRVPQDFRDSMAASKGLKGPGRPRKHAAREESRPAYQGVTRAAVPPDDSSDDDAFKSPPKRREASPDPASMPDRKRAK